MAYNCYYHIIITLFIVSPSNENYKGILVMQFISRSKANILSKNKWYCTENNL